MGWGGCAIKRCLCFLPLSWKSTVRAHTVTGFLSPFVGWLYILTTLQWSRSIPVGRISFWRVSDSRRKRRVYLEVIQQSGEKMIMIDWTPGCQVDSPGAKAKEEGEKSIQRLFARDMNLNERTPLERWNWNRNASYKTAGKWQKCNLDSGMASVASDMGWLWTEWISPAPVQMSGMLSGRHSVVIVCGLLQGLVVFSLTSCFFVNGHLDHSRAWIPACSLTVALMHRCFPSNLSTTTQGAIVKLRGASSELWTLFIWSV